MINNTSDHGGMNEHHMTFQGGDSLSTLFTDALALISLHVYTTYRFQTQKRTHK